ncbi:MAG: AAA family ATPase [Chthoniobacteraceae bacterium]
MSGSRGIYDPLAGGATTGGAETAGHSRNGETATKPPKFLEWFSPSELRDFQEPEGHNLVGDYHLQRGAISVLAGAPGVGKSRAALSLAIRGAYGEGDWFGLPVHCQFRTLMLQNENGLVRLHHDFEEIKLPAAFDSWLKVSSPPPLGMLMDNPLFRIELRAMVKDFSPHLLTVDPWNSVARDAMEKDYQQAFVWLREVLSESKENPACLVVAHTRKPKADDRARGRGLINLISGSYTIFSVPRSAMILQSASDEMEDDRVVFSVVKNNDGKSVKPTAWERRDGDFFEAEDFDWSEFNEGSGSKKKGPAVSEEHLRELFDEGAVWLSQKEAVERLEALAGVKRSTAYAALKVMGGPYSALMRRREDGAIGLAESVAK